MHNATSSSIYRGLLFTDRIMLMSHNAVSLFVEMENRKMRKTKKHTNNDANWVQPTERIRKVVFNILKLEQE